MKPREDKADTPATTKAIPDPASLGAETRAERSAKRIVPWISSIAIHAALIAAGFLFTWSIVLTERHERPPVIVADFHALTYDPVVPSEQVQGEALTESPMVELDLPPLDQTLDATLSDFEFDLESVLPDALPAPTGADFAPPPAQGSVSFLGVSTSNVRRIVYVIDASGSMIAYLQIILQELARSLDAMTPQQSFAIVFFQENRAIQVPPVRRLTPATPSNKTAALRWIREGENIIPRGRSNPLAAFEVAMQMNPDVIFLLSDRIRGAGIYEIDQQELLAQLDRLNPLDRGGRRRTHIHTIQFLDPDPLNTLQIIAQQHGSPEGRSYRFVSRRELGLAAPE